MDALCLDILHSDWHDSRHHGSREDHLLKTGWLEQVLARWGLDGGSPPNEHDRAELQALRTLMQEIAQSLIQKQVAGEREISRLNAYLDAAPSRMQIVRGRDEQNYQLQQVPLHNDWSWVLGQVAISFVELITQHDTARIKQCENPDCRWIYYDESANQTRRWCDDSCANLMRVRKHRTKRREASKA